MCNRKLEKLMDLKGELRSKKQHGCIRGALRWYGEKHLDILQTFSSEQNYESSCV